MRKISLLALPFALTALPLGAQRFEGNLTLTVLGENIQEMHWSIKGGRSAASFDLNSPLGVLPIRYFVDNVAKTNTMLMPLPGAAGGSKGMQLTAALTPAVPEDGRVAMAKPRKLGTTQTISGITCTDYELGDAQKTQACIADGMGLFAYPTAPLGGAGSRIASTNGAVTTSGSPLSFRALDGTNGDVQVMDLGNGRVMAMVGTTGDQGGQVRTMVMDPQGAGGGSTGVTAGGGGGGTADRQSVSMSVTRSADPNAPPQVTEVRSVNGQVVSVNGQTLTDQQAKALTEAMAVSGDRMSAIRAMQADGSLPSMAMPSQAPAGGASALPGWVDALGTTGFPLKVWRRDGTTLLQVTEAYANPVSDATFAIPEGYTAVGGGGGVTTTRRSGGN